MPETTFRPVYSFVLDEGARFAYQAWHLAHSLVGFCGARPADINIQCTNRADSYARYLLDKAGFVTHSLPRFGDGKFCNKIAQFDNLNLCADDVAVLLDTDTIAVGDLREWLDPKCVLGKVVDASNPPLPTMSLIANAAGIEIPGDICRTDSDDGDTYIGNFNGGMYSIPSEHCAALSREWRRWAEWLLSNRPLLGEGRYSIHVDQVSFWLALHTSKVPFRAAPANLNYFTHFDAPHLHFDSTHEIALLHYHNQALNVLGLIEPGVYLSPDATRAVNVANEQIGRSFQNALFWSFRYEHFPERGSGVGSRGMNGEYKRELLREHGIESASSVLDVGCGDLEVIRPFELRKYIGIDVSQTAIRRARHIMPEGLFLLGMDEGTPSADFVLCLEVLIHQPTAEEYNRVINFITARTKRTLIVSGYSSGSEAIDNNPMVFFHEPLAQSLFATGRFSELRQVGAHTDVAIFRCDV